MLYNPFTEITRITKYQTVKEIGASEQTTDQWQQLYVLTNQITGVTNVSLNSATGNAMCFLSSLLLIVYATTPHDG